MSTPSGGSPSPGQQQGKPHTGDLSEKVKKKNAQTTANSQLRDGR